MANFESVVLTENGLRLLTKASSGDAEDVLRFTHMAIGHGILPENANPEQLTDLTQKITDMEIIRFDITGPGVSEVTGMITNSQFSEPVTVFEVGVYAEDPDNGGEVLYMYSYTRSTPAYIDPPNPTPVVIEISLVTIIDDAENVTANVIFPLYAGSVRYKDDNTSLEANNVQSAIEKLKAFIISTANALQSAINGIIQDAVTTAGTALSKSGNALNHQNYGTEGTYTKVTTNAQGHVTSGSNVTAGDIPNLDWSKITTGKPATLAGYGITDAAPSSHVGAGGTAQHPLANGTTAGFSLNDFTAALKTKLDGIATGATKVTIENVLTSTATANALSAAQGKALQDNKVAKAGDTMTGTLTTRSVNIQSGYVLQHNGTTIIDTSGIVARAKYNDLAELFPKPTVATVGSQGSADLEPGDVVGYNWVADTVCKGYNQNEFAVVGVYSDTYGMILGGEEEKTLKENLITHVPIGLTGRVNVKVTGAVNPGDILVASSIPGVAFAKRHNYSKKVGIALAPHSGSEIDKIPMMVSR
ncbi:MAG: hypothetical protein LBS84_06520 [Clostridiales bacterium]|jgi:hypothetical protein|nr:hypothetical protein [Clostridiales bacterium]